MKNLRSIITIFVCALTVGISAMAQGTSTADKPAPSAAPVSDPLVQSIQGKNDRYRIGFQDVLDIQVFNQPKLNQRVGVSPNGTINLFRLDHPVVAVCKTERELAIAIEDAYREHYLRDPQVNVVVAEQKSQSVMVIGAVEKPGNYFVNRRVHLLEMLALAGGPNKESGTRMLVARTGSSTNCKGSGDPADLDPNAQIEVVDFKIRDVQQGKKTFWMEPGDVVSVLDADTVYVYGNVNKQGSFKVRDPITLTQAIVTSEGLKSTAKRDYIRILRQRPDSIQRDELIFDLNQIDKGKVKDPYLEPNDIVAVSEDSTKRILFGIGNLIKSAAPSALYRLP